MYAARMQAKRSLQNYMYIGLVDFLTVRWLNVWACVPSRCELEAANCVLGPKKDPFEIEQISSTYNFLTALRGGEYSVSWGRAKFELRGGIE